MAGMEGKAGGLRNEPNVVPMIDVLLVLLIIFMIIVPIKSTGLDASIPQDPGDQAPAPEPTTVVARVNEDRSLEINTQPVEWADLDRRLKEIYARRPNGVLFVGAAANTDYEYVARVIDSARGAGIYRVALLR